MPIKWITAALLLLGLACTGSRSGLRGGLPESQVATFSPDVQASYRLFAQRCSRCHTLSRPLDADIDDPDHWDNYVSRMRKHSGSGISPADAEKILIFLEYWTKIQNAPPVPTSTTAGGGA